MNSIKTEGNSVSNLTSVIYSPGGGSVLKSYYINIDGTFDDWERLQVLAALDPRLEINQYRRRQNLPSIKRKQRIATVKVTGAGRGPQKYNAITVDELIQRLSETV